MPRPSKGARPYKRKARYRTETGATSMTSTAPMCSRSISQMSANLQISLRSSRELDALTNSRGSKTLSAVNAQTCGQCVKHRGNQSGARRDQPFVPRLIIIPKKAFIRG
jgi:hypothetical protein